MFDTLHQRSLHFEPPVLNPTRFSKYFLIDKAKFLNRALWGLRLSGCRIGSWTMSIWGAIHHSKPQGYLVSRQNPPPPWGGTAARYTILLLPATGGECLSQKRWTSIPVLPRDLFRQPVQICQYPNSWDNPARTKNLDPHSQSRWHRLSRPCIGQWSSIANLEHGPQSQFRRAISCTSAPSIAQSLLHPGSRYPVKSEPTRQGFGIGYAQPLSPSRLSRPSTLSRNGKYRLLWNQGGLHRSRLPEDKENWRGS